MIFRSKFGLLAGKPSLIPSQHNVDLSSEPTYSDPKLKNIIEYQKLVGEIDSHSQLMRNLLKFHLDT
ncbi:hypothetical protein Tco_0369392 [Tanacetum coccineum]